MTTKYPLILDASHTDTLDLVAAKAAGVVAVFLKATEGGTFKDPKFSDRFKQAVDLGLLPGAYHFDHVSHTPQQQADFFFSVVTPVAASAGVDIRDVRFAVDDEPEGGSQVPQADARALCDAIAAGTALNVRPAYYGFLSSLRDRYPMASDPIGQNPLWISLFNQDPLHTLLTQMPAPWAVKKQTILQFTDHGVHPKDTTIYPPNIPGCVCDLSIFNGTETELRTWWAAARGCA